jgi:gas vesicle protein
MGVGSLIALLFAPKSGKQLRRDLRRSYLDARGAVEDFAAETRERVEDAIERGSDWVDDLEQTARKRVAPLERALRRER